MTDTYDINAIVEATPPDTLLLVDVWKENCPPCKVLSQQIERVEEELSERDTGRSLIVVKVRADLVPNFCVTHKVSSAPTLILFRGGEVLATKVGATGGYAALRSMLDPHL